MPFVKRLLALCLACAVPCWADGNSFDRVRYNGGSVDSKVDPKEWKNHLTVTSDLITLELKDGKKVAIPAKSVTSLSYGQEAHRRVGTMVALAVLVSPVALFGLFHKTRLHYIGIQYSTPDEKSAGILLQGDKDNYRAMVVALQGVTGAPVSVAEKDREFLPVGVKTTLAKNSEPAGEAASGGPDATLEVACTPSGADVLVDGEFVGNCPSTLKVAAGKHVVLVKMAGYRDWSREVSVRAGSAAQLTAALEK